MCAAGGDTLHSYAMNETVKFEFEVLGAGGSRELVLRV
jgi:hypothetical protein